MADDAQAVDDPVDENEGYLLPDGEVYDLDSDADLGQVHDELAKAVGDASVHVVLHPDSIDNDLEISERYPAKVVVVGPHSKSAVRKVLSNHAPDPDYFLTDDERASQEVVKMAARGEALSGSDQVVLNKRLAALLGVSVGGE